MTDYILEIRNLSTRFFTRSGPITAVERLNLNIERGTTLGLVGESGSGKSMTSLSIMRLVPPPGKIVEGEILLDGTDLLRLEEREMRRVRGARIAMIFQDPMTSLNPVFTVGDQIAEAIKIHKGLSRSGARLQAIDTMTRVRIPDAARRAKEYPHQLSGGLRQRVMIAMALSCNPELLIADEPTTALDVTIQAEILDLLKSLRDDFDLSMLLITHDLGVVAHTADRVAVMYAGRIVEEGPVKELFRSPSHPYTEGLLRSVPRPERESEHRSRLQTIEGSVPNLLKLPPGCKFEPRCSYATAECVETEPDLLTISGDRRSRCIHFEEVWRKPPGLHRGEPVPQRESEIPKHG
jgi:oligopeptide/dipeptide ABC transporter ATP-binding protein